MSIIANYWASSPALCYYGNSGSCVVLCVPPFLIITVVIPLSGPEDPKIRRLVQQKAHLVIKAYFAQHGEYTTTGDLEKLKCVLHEHGYRQ